MQKLSVSIVIPCLNEEAYIEKCVLSTQKQNYKEAPISVFVVDGMSTDATREKVKQLSIEYPSVELIDNPDRFTPKALNLGIEASATDVVIILGAHAEIAPDFVARNVAHLKTDERIGCAGGIIQNVYENETAEVIGRAMSSPFGVGNARFRTGGKKGFVDTVAFGAYRREALNEIGLFDLDLVRNQDDELNYRLTKAGWKIFFDPEIKSEYYVRSSFAKLFKQYKQYGYWKVYVNKKHNAVTSVRQLIPFLFVAYMALALVLAFVPSIGLSPAVLGAFLWFLAGITATILVKTRSAKYTGVLFTFLILHVSYGIGYGQGIWQFLILGKSPSKAGKKLTR